MKHFILLLTVAAVCTSLTSIAQTVVELQPGPFQGQDVTVRWDVKFDLEHQNFGEEGQLHAHTWTHGMEPMVGRFLIHFDLSEYGPMENLVAAYLNLYNNPEGSFEGRHQAYGTCTGGSCTNPKNDARVELITEPWDEHSVTWDTCPASTPIHNVRIPALMNSQQDVRVDVTPLIREMYTTEPPTNYGFLIRLNKEEKYTCLVFTSSEYSDATRRPKLELIFETPTGTDNPAQPGQMKLSSYPNPVPARHTATAIFTLPTAQHLSLALYDVQGRKVASLAEGSYMPGTHTVPVRTTDLSAGVYMYRLTADAKTMTRMLLIQ